MTESYALGEAIGLSAGLAMVAFVTTKRMLKKRRSAERADALSRGEKPSPKSTVFKCLPWAASLLVGSATCATQLSAESESQYQVYGSNTSQATVLGDAKTGVAFDVAKFRIGFKRGCMRKCSAGGVPAGTCEKSCDCSIGELHKRYPEDKALIALINSTDRAARDQAVAAATVICFSGLQAQ